MRWRRSEETQERRRGEEKNRCRGKHRQHIPYKLTNILYNSLEKHIEYERASALAPFGINTTELKGNRTHRNSIQANHGIMEKVK